jgi:anaerobic selenocysteine-containing dehydrogenase
VHLHPETAGELGIRQDQKVVVETPWGAVTQRAHLTDRVHPRVVLADYGWWFPERTEDPLRGWAEANLNRLTPVDETDPVMATPRVRALPCRIRKP